jgi:signal peptidase I
VVVFNVPPKSLNDGVDYPIDLKTNYIKRCVAIPGDTLTVVNRQVIVNRKPLKNPEKMQFSYIVTANSEINERIFEKYDISDRRKLGYSNGFQYHMYISPAIAEELKALPFIKSVEVKVQNPMNGAWETRDEKDVESNIFPNADYYPWNGDFYGPLVIPKEGMTIAVNDSSMATYGQTILLYDHNDDVKVDGGKLFIDGKEVTEYTFKQDYYFMMGDNRHNSLDSRYWGFVPADHIVGKAFFIWLSIDKNASFAHKIRWSRFFNLIE